MELTVERVDVWAVSIKDEPGGLSWMLGELRAVGANLDFVLARRSPDKPGLGALFVAPLRGDAQIAAAIDLGFAMTNSVHSLRVEGDNKAGIAADLTTMLADAGINLRGLSAAVAGERFILYIGFDSRADADHALDILHGAFVGAGV